MDEFALEDLIDPRILQEVQDAFSRFTGMAALMTDANGTPVTKGSAFTRFCMDMTRKSESGCARCEACDRQGALDTLESGKPSIYSCHAGLTDYAAPILLNGRFVGSFIGGQVRTGPLDEAFIRERAAEYGIDPDEYVAAAAETRELPIDIIERAAQFLTEMSGTLSRIAYQRLLMQRQNESIERTAADQADMVSKYVSELLMSAGELEKRLDEALDQRSKAPDYDAQRGEEIKSRMSHLISQIGELSELTEDAMDAFSLGEDRLELREVVYDIRQLMGNRIMGMRRRGREYGHLVEMSFDDAVPEQMMGAPETIGRIVDKLVEYSMDMLGGTGTLVRVSCAARSYSDDLVIEVRNPESFLSQDMMNRIRRKAEPTGQGLADRQDELAVFILVGSYIRALSGSFDAQSNRGEGTVFTLRIPQLAA